MDQRIKFYSQNTNLLPPKPKSTFRHLKQGIEDFHRKYVLVPADKAANNVDVVCRGETIHRNYGASRFSGHDSVHDSFSPSFDTVRFTQV